jgi:peptidoglycan hydrolase-like protein with peptidoglycan-binding domain
MRKSELQPPPAKSRQNLPARSQTHARAPSASAVDAARVRADVAARATRPVQAKEAAPTGYDDLIAAAQKGRSQPGPTTMPEPVWAKMEGAFGADFSDVRLHAGSPRAAELGAVAFTQGSDVHVAPGHWAPETTKGQELLGHELAHVVQQRDGRVRETARRDGVALNDDPTLEREADAMGADAARGGATTREEAESHRVAAPSDAAPVQRQPEPPAANRLQSPRFAASAKLERCFEDKDRLGPDDPDRDAVTRIQQALVDVTAITGKAYDLGPTGADGIYGPKTAAAVMKFKKDERLGSTQFPDVGPGTMHRLDQLFQKPKPVEDTRKVPNQFVVTTKEKGEVGKDGTVKKEPKVEVKTTGSTTINTAASGKGGGDESGFQFVGQAGTQHPTLLRLYGPPVAHNDCDFVVLQVGAKYNWRGIPLGPRLSLFSEPELDFSVAPALCSTNPFFTPSVQVNLLKFVILKDVWEASLKGTFGLADGWLKNFGTQQQGGLALEWKPWGASGKAYSGLKFGLTGLFTWTVFPNTPSNNTLDVGGQVTGAIELP